MARHGVRNSSRRLVLELVAVVLLAGVPIDFPRGVASGQAWSFLGRHPSSLLHAALGAVVLVEAVVAVLRSVGATDRRLVALTLIGLAGAGLAVGSGVAYVAGGQTEAMLTGMTAGWLASIVVYGVTWRLTRGASRAAGVTR